VTEALSLSVSGRCVHRPGESSSISLQTVCTSGEERGNQSIISFLPLRLLWNVSVYMFTNTADDADSVGQSEGCSSHLSLRVSSAGVPAAFHQGQSGADLSSVPQ